jgi:hypothetical protein
LELLHHKIIREFSPLIILSSPEVVAILKVVLVVVLARVEFAAL